MNLTMNITTGTTEKYTAPRCAGPGLPDFKEKKCSKCLKILPIELFNIRARGDKVRYREHCVNCRPANSQVNYGLSPGDKQIMINEQGGTCAICKRVPKKWAVDHDHRCCPWSGGRRITCGLCVRGLLCYSCNSNLGWFEKLSNNIHAYLSTNDPTSKENQHAKNSINLHNV